MTLDPPTIIATAAVATPLAAAAVKHVVSNEQDELSAAEIVAIQRKEEIQDELIIPEEELPDELFPKGVNKVHTDEINLPTTVTEKGTNHGNE